MKRFLVSLSFVAVMGMTTLLPSALSAQPLAVPVNLEFEIKIPTERREHRVYREKGPLHCRWINGHWALGRHREWIWVDGYRSCWRVPQGNRR